MENKLKTIHGSSMDNRIDSKTKANRQRENKAIVTEENEIFMFQIGLELISSQRRKTKTKNGRKALHTLAGRPRRGALQARVRKKNDGGHSAGGPVPPP